MKKFFQNANKILMTGITAVVVFLLQFMWFLSDADYKVPMWILMLSFIGIWATWVITYAICSGSRTIAYELPQIRTAHISPSRITFIVEQNNLYNLDSLVSIYHSDDNDIETFLGIGYVENKMEAKGFHQIAFTQPIDNDDVKKILKSIKDDSATKRRIKIKPSIPVSYLGGVF